jgi:hypothetical protein
MGGSSWGWRGRSYRHWRRWKIKYWFWRGRWRPRTLAGTAQTAGQILGLGALAHGLADELLEALVIAEADLGLGRVDVDVNLVGRQIQVQKRDGVPPRHEQAAVGSHRSEAGLKCSPDPRGSLR